MKYWEIIADNLSKAGWSWGCVSAIGPGVTMELWDPFFGAMKSTQLFLTQLPMSWEADVDLRSNTWETLLGLG